MNNQPIAHAKQDDNGGWRENPLSEHLHDVGKFASEFAMGFNGGDWARVAGLWHDLGKYSIDFQRYIRNVTGYEREEAHIEASGRVDHSTAGALWAIKQFKEHGRILAYLIAGHHAGLPDWYPSESAGKALSARLEQAELLEKALSQVIPADILEQSKPDIVIPGGRDGFALWLRILFSCLVDADFLDTEVFMDQDKADERQRFPSLAELLPAFNRHMQKMASKEQTQVNQIRTDVLKQCRDKAALPSGLFSLTVPTGGGKTLSSMAFALNHAIRHNKKRIIYVIPYTSIIEQTANILREIFGQENVVEHHSNLDPDKESSKSRLATENWDAPIIVTTNVQFFESLFAVKTSRCRKLHNVVNSVVILDEAQMLPPEFLSPILKVIGLLAKHYCTSLVLSTATQPALNGRSGFGWTFKGLDNVQEIMDNPDALYKGLERVTVKLPENLSQPNTWEEIAAQLQTHKSVLCIVNRRNDCRTLFRLMPKGAIHLSALMCGEHRSQVVQDIKDRLRRHEPVRVISTQLVEAGVDLDFPVVYRALAGLDSIAQAAGRCNREGRMERGKVVVFVPPKPAPVGLLRKGEQTTMSLLSGYSGDNPLTLDMFRQYFEHFYRKADLDKHGIEDLLKPGDKLEVQFRSAAAKFRLIDETGQVVFVLFNDESKAMIDKLEKDGPARWLMRKLQRHSVNLPERQFQELLKCGDVREIYPGMFAQVSDVLYHSEMGLLIPEESPSPASLVSS